MFYYMLVLLTIANVVFAFNNDKLVEYTKSAREAGINIKPNLGVLKSIDFSKIIEKETNNLRKLAKGPSVDGAAFYIMMNQYNHPQDCINNYSPSSSSVLPYYLGAHCIPVQGQYNLFTAPIGCTNSDAVQPMQLLMAFFHNDKCSGPPLVAPAPMHVPIQGPLPGCNNMVPMSTHCFNGPELPLKNEKDAYVME